MRNNGVVAQQPNLTAPAGPTAKTVEGEHTGKRLGAFLCWAVVFADIGTSIYYVPGILFGQQGIGDLAGLFVSMTMAVFLLLTLKYAEVSVRFPEGGGVVTVAARGLNPWAGAVGGMFILVDYFLTSAISSLSGVQYFETIVPALSSTFVQVVITITLVVLLGILNWYGIKESAIVSAAIAIAAFVSDILILLFLAFRVPPAVIGQVFQVMFRGEHLTVPVVLTGFAGSFLAFSGLESISQLAPVMRVPRSKTVTWALALVVITVGITSPLLTIFSTVLLTHPALLHQAHLLPPRVTDLTQLQTQFISQLGFSAGGTILEVLTAITAATLLVFASNTAIIGAYHVFLALSRMRFFPKIIERRNKLRDTPHIAIAVATVIPILVLVAVAGNIAILGDMYAFGLLGAFALTCVALDVIRWRERHGEAHVGSTEEDDEHAGQVVEQVAAQAHGAARWSRRLAPVLGRFDPETLDRPHAVWVRIRAGGTEVAQALHPVAVLIRRVWPDLKFSLGLLTTVLVCGAWAINLKSKPLATGFGGGLTILGVAVSIVHYRYQQQRGQQPIFLMSRLRPIRRSILVVLAADSARNREVVRAAIEGADGHTLVFLYLGRPQPREVQPFEIYDPYAFDEEAQRTLSAAGAAARHAHVPAQFAYRVGGPDRVLDAWRVIRPDAIIAEAALAKTISKRVAPDYVRYQQLDGVRVAHYVKHFVAGLDAERAGERTTAPRMTVIPGAAPGQNGARSVPRAAGVEGEPRAAALPLAEGVSANNGSRASGGGAAPIEQQPAAAATRTPAGSAATEPSDQEEAAGVDIEDYVWTGTELVRKDELERRERERREREAERERPGGEQSEEGASQ